MGISVWTRRRPAVPPAAPAGSAADRDQPADAAAGAGSTSAANLDWEALEARVRSCAACGLHATRTRTVFGVGAHDADWMVIGEAPGANEDRQGEPFVGRAGKLLNAMLRAVGLTRDEVFIANALKCRPPGNRDPRPDETAQCAPFLERQIELVTPKVILAVGRIAAQTLLATNLPLARLRGRRHLFPGTPVPLVVTYHPAYLLRSPQQKAKAWEDLRLARSIVESTP